MEPVRIREAAAAMSGVLIAGAGDESISSVSTDTRTLSRGELFIALAGKNYDGHAYLDEAVERGAAVVVYSRAPEGAERRWSETGTALIRVRDTLDALQCLARWYRARFSLTLVAVTGSNGKTTTKDMIGAIVSQRCPVLCSEGTYNNHVGVPLTLLRIERAHAVGVMEIGMNAQGEIARLAAIADPEMGVVTNVGPAHLEFLGSLENVASSKKELLEAMTAPGRRGRISILNCDDPYVARMGEQAGLEVRTFGMGIAADVGAEQVKAAKCGISFTAVFRRAGKKVGITVPALGLHNVYNALAAAATCEALGAEPEEIARGLGGLVLPPMRMQVSRRNGILLVNDAYNANPASMRAAVQTLRDMSVKGRRILVMGDMLELGPAAALAHEEVGRLAAAQGIDVLIAVGELSARAAAAAREAGMPRESLAACRDIAEAAAALKGRARSGDCVLLKASRKMALEEILKLW